MVQAIHALQDAGVEPDVWKIEGLDRREDCEKIVAAARRGGRDKVGCIILGRGEDDKKVREWLTTAAGVPGFIGFAVGRTDFLGAAGRLGGPRRPRARPPSRRLPDATGSSSTSFEKARAWLSEETSTNYQSNRIMKNTCDDATRNDRTGPDGREHGAAAHQGRPSVRRLRQFRKRWKTWQRRRPSAPLRSRTS